MAYLVRGDAVTYADVVYQTLQVRDFGMTERAPNLVSYKSSVDRSGEDFGFIYVSRFCAVAKLQRHKIGRLWNAKRADLFNSGWSGLGEYEGIYPLML